MVTKTEYTARWLILTLVTLGICAYCQQPSHAGGLYDAVTMPVDGQVVTYRRSPYISISNPLDQAIIIEFTTEQVKLFPTGDTVKSIVRRVPINANEYMGKAVPLINPADGNQIGYLSAEQYYALTYSLFILAEKQADGLVRSKGQILCYVTSATDQVCP
jgi:hypothetical protein